VSGTTILVDADGCCKQYRCGNSKFFNSLLSSTHGITIDQAIGAPGHGKDVVEGLNAINKRYLSGNMCLIGATELNDSDKLMQAHAMINGTESKSLAEECKRLCEAKERVSGVKSHRKYNK
jgi:hypothetical protein